jgi:hypothetical protein
MALKLTLGFETAPGSATNFHGVKPSGSVEMNSSPSLFTATHSDTDGHVKAEGYRLMSLGRLIEKATVGADQVNAVGVDGTLVEVVLVGDGLVVLVGAVVVVEIGFGPLLV